MDDVAVFRPRSLPWISVRPVCTFGRPRALDSESYGCGTRKRDLGSIDCRLRGDWDERETMSDRFCPGNFSPCWRVKERLLAALMVTRHHFTTSRAHGCIRIYMVALPKIFCIRFQSAVTVGCAFGLCCTRTARRCWLMGLSDILLTVPFH